MMGNWISQYWTLWTIGLAATQSPFSLKEGHSDTIQARPKYTAQPYGWGQRSWRRTFCSLHTTVLVDKCDACVEMCRYSLVSLLDLIDAANT